MSEKTKCPSCAQLNDPEAEYCWACYKALRPTAAAAAPAAPSAPPPAATVAAATSSETGAEPLPVDGRVRFAALCYLAVAYLQLLFIRAEASMARPYGLTGELTQAAAAAVVAALLTSSRRRFVPVVCTALLFALPYLFVRSGVEDVGRLLAPLVVFLLVPTGVVWSAREEFRGGWSDPAEVLGSVWEGLTAQLRRPRWLSALCVAAGACLMTAGFWILIHVVTRFDPLNPGKFSRPTARTVGVFLLLGGAVTAAPGLTLVRPGDLRNFGTNIRVR